MTYEEAIKTLEAIKNLETICKIAELPPNSTLGTSKDVGETEHKGDQKGMKGLFIPEITAEMFRNGSLESVEALMAEGEIYDIDYSPWIPVKWHEITEDERVKEEYPSEWLVHIDCILPEDGEEILITTKHGYVEKDTAYCDDGYYLDSGYDWVDDVVAWMPLPEPYKASPTGTEGCDKE